MISFVQIAIFTVYAQRIRLHQRLDQLLHISMASGISLCAVTCMALVVFLFNLYRMHRIIISKRLLFKAYPRFATDKCGRISDFIVSLSIALHMERVFVLVRFCITDIISSSQFIGTLKVKKALNRNKQNGKIRTTFCGLLSWSNSHTRGGKTSGLSFENALYVRETSRRGYHGI